MKLNKAIEGFCLARLADSYSPITVERYQGCLKKLGTFLSNPDITKITIDDLRRFMVWLSRDYKPVRFSGDQSPLSGASLDMHWRAIRSFFNWVSSEFEFERPDLILERPRYQSPPIQPFTKDEIRNLLQACRKTAGSKNVYRRPTAQRDLAILMVLLDTGIRRGELVRLLVNDLNRDENTHTYHLRIRPYRSGLKSRPRIVYCGRSTSRYLWRYLAEREVVYDDDPLFLTRDDRSLDGQFLYNLLRRTGERAGVPKANPHRFRHTFAIQYLRNGGDVFTLQRLLGHSTMSMVKRYLAISKADDKEAHRRASPGDRWRL